LEQEEDNYKDDEIVKVGEDKKLKKSEKITEEPKDELKNKANEKTGNEEQKKDPNEGKITKEVKEDKEVEKYPKDKIKEESKEPSNEAKVLTKIFDVQKEREKLALQKAYAAQMFDKILASLRIDPLSEEYNMIHKRRGYCIIICNKIFHSKYLQERNGAEKDLHDLELCFQNLGFETKPYQDLTVSEIRAVLKTGEPLIQFSVTKRYHKIN